MNLFPPEQSQPSIPLATKAIKCPGCTNVFNVALADDGKGINFLNVVAWFCPKCKKNNITPFVSEIEQ